MEPNSKTITLVYSNTHHVHVHVSLSINLLYFILYIYRPHNIEEIIMGISASKQWDEMNEVKQALDEAAAEQQMKDSTSTASGSGEKKSFKSKLRSRILKSGKTIVSIVTVSLIILYSQTPAQPVKEWTGHR